MFRSKSLSRLSCFGLKVGSGKNEGTHNKIKTKSIEDIETIQNRDNASHKVIYNKEDVRRIRSEIFSSKTNQNESTSLFDVLQKTFDKSKRRSSSCSRLLESNAGLFSGSDKYAVTKYFKTLNMKSSTKPRVMLKDENVLVHNKLIQIVNERLDLARSKLECSINENKLKSDFDALCKNIYASTKEYKELSQKLHKLPKTTSSTSIVRQNSKILNDQLFLNDSNNDIDDAQKFMKSFKLHPSINLKTQYEIVSKDCKNTECKCSNIESAKELNSSLSLHNSRKRLNESVEANYDKQFQQADKLDLLKAKSRYKLSPSFKYDSNRQSVDINSKDVFFNKTFYANDKIKESHYKSPYIFSQKNTDSTYMNCDANEFKSTLPTKEYDVLRILDDTKGDSVSPVNENKRSRQQLQELKNIYKIFSSHSLEKSSKIGKDNTLNKNSMSFSDYSIRKSQNDAKDKTSLESKKYESHDAGLISLTIDKTFNKELLKVNTTLLDKNPIVNPQLLSTLPLPLTLQRSSVKLMHSAAFKEIDVPASDAWERNKHYKPDKNLVCSMSKLKLAIKRDKKDMTKLSGSNGSLENSNVEDPGKENKKKHQRVVAWNSAKNYKSNGTLTFSGEEILNRDRYLNDISPSVIKNDAKKNKKELKSVAWDRKNVYVPNDNFLYFKGEMFLEQQKIEHNTIDQSEKSNQINAQPWDCRKGYLPDKHSYLQLNSEVSQDWLKKQSGILNMESVQEKDIRKSHKALGRKQKKQTSLISDELELANSNCKKRDTLMKDHNNFKTEKIQCQKGKCCKHFTKNSLGTKSHFRVTRSNVGKIFISQNSKTDKQKITKAESTPHSRKAENFSCISSDIIDEMVYARKVSASIKSKLKDQNSNDTKISSDLNLDQTSKKEQDRNEKISQINMSTDKTNFGLEVAREDPKLNTVNKCGKVIEKIHSRNISFEPTIKAQTTDLSPKSNMDSDAKDIVPEKVETIVTVKSKSLQNQTTFSADFKKRTEDKRNADVVNHGFITKIIKVNKNLSDELKNNQSSMNINETKKHNPQVHYGDTSTAIARKQVRKSPLPTEENITDFSLCDKQSLNQSSLRLRKEQTKSTNISDRTADKTKELAIEQNDKSTEMETTKIDLNKYQVTNVTQYIELFDRIYVDPTKATNKDPSTLETVISTHGLVQNDKPNYTVNLNLEDRAVEIKENQLKNICTDMLDTAKKQNETLSESFLESKIVMNGNPKPKSNVYQDMITEYYKKKTECNAFLEFEYENKNEIDQGFNIPKEETFVDVASSPQKETNAAFKNVNQTVNISKEETLVDIAANSHETNTILKKPNQTVDTYKDSCYDDIGCSIVDTDTANKLNADKITKEKFLLKNNLENLNKIPDNIAVKDEEISVNNMDFQKSHAERMADFYEYEEKILGIQPPDSLAVKMPTKHSVDMSHVQNKNKIKTNENISLNKTTDSAVNENEQLHFEDTYVIIHSGENESVSPINRVTDQKKNNMIKEKTSFEKTSKISNVIKTQLGKETDKERDSNIIQEGIVLSDVKETIKDVTQPEKSQSKSKHSDNLHSKHGKVEKSLIEEDLPLNTSLIHATITKVIEKQLRSEWPKFLDKVQYYKVPADEKSQSKVKEVSVKDFMRVMQGEPVVNNSLENVEFSSKEDIQKYMPNKISKFMLQSLFKTIFDDENETKKSTVKNEEETVIKQLVTSVKETKNSVHEDSSQKIPLMVINDERFPMVNIKKNNFCYPSMDTNVTPDFNDNVRYKHIPSVSKILNDTLSHETKRALHKWESEKLNTLRETELYKFYQDQLTNDVQFHDCVRRHIMGTPVDLLMENVSKETKGCMISLHDVFSKLKNITLLESSAVHSQLPYHGIVDCIARFKGEPVLIEWKQADHPKSVKDLTSDAPVQLAAYIGAINHDTQHHFSIKSGVIVVAYTDGSPADIVTLSNEECEMYWKKWLQRIQKYMSLRYQ